VHLDLVRTGLVDYRNSYDGYNYTEYMTPLKAGRYGNSNKNAGGTTDYYIWNFV
jgi:hypothetical protein